MEKQKILIVDDAEVNRLILENLFCQEYDILHAENGEIALKIIKECCGAIDLILLDIMMPVMDGKVFLQELQKKNEYNVIPVVVISSESEKDCRRMLEMGARAFIHKPFSDEKVRVCVEQILN